MLEILPVNMLTLSAEKLIKIGSLVPEIWPDKVKSQGAHLFAEMWYLFWHRDLDFQGHRGHKGQIWLVTGFHMITQKVLKLSH